MANHAEKASLGISKLDRFLQFLRDVRAEVTKVTWPSAEEVKGATLVVIIVCIFVALVIWGLDSIIKLGVQAVF